MNARRSPLSRRMPLVGQPPRSGRVPLAGRLPRSGRVPLAGRLPLRLAVSPPTGRVALAGPAPRLAIAAMVCLWSALGAAAVSADPASSAESAWSPLPSEDVPEPGDPLEARGREVFDQRCRACHGEVPEEIFGPVFLPPMPGTQALRARYGGALPAALEARTDLSSEYVTAVVRDGLMSMPPFRPTELSDDDLEALVAYLTSERRAAGR